MFKKLVSAKLCGTSLANVSSPFVVPFHINDYSSLSMLIDSGSDLSFVSDDISNKYPTTSCNSLICTSFCNERLYVRQFCQLEGKVDDYSISGKFYSVPLPKGIDLICGNDILTRYCASIVYNPSPSITFMSPLGNRLSCNVTCTPQLSFKINDSLSGDKKKELALVLSEFSDVFSSKSDEIGHTNVAKHVINTGNHLPFKSRNYQVPHGLRKKNLMKLFNKCYRMK